MLKLPAYAINHDNNRLQYVHNLMVATKLTINISKASDGSEWWNSGIQLKHPWGNEVLTRGTMGCTKSHLNLLTTENRDGVIIFEDDAELIMSMDNVDRFVESIHKTYGNNWDIILLGANEYVSSKPLSHEITRVYRFWGTHAMIVNANSYDYIKKTFFDSMEDGIFLPADWMYNETIRRFKLRVFAPSSPQLFFRQVPGLVSGITGRVR